MKLVIKEEEEHRKEETEKGCMEGKVECVKERE